MKPGRSTIGFGGLALAVALLGSVTLADLRTRSDLGPVTGWGIGLQLDRFVYSPGATARATALLWNLTANDAVRTLAESGRPEGCHFRWWITDAFGVVVHRPDTGSCFPSLTSQWSGSGTWIAEPFEMELRYRYSDTPDVGDLQPGVYRLNIVWAIVGGPKPADGSSGPDDGSGRPSATMDFRIEAPA